MEIKPFVIFILSALFKVLLFPAYKSTDFEVHRNWLAITHSLPLSRWYYEDTSQWTLDYPPLFGWFEWLLSQVAVLIDPAIVEVQNLNYSATSCVIFQRFTVILTEFVLYYAVLDYCKFQTKTVFAQDNLVKMILSFQMFLNFGLLIVDHIHFQYNGFLFGIFLLSVSKIMQNQHLLGAFLFACLLNLKHIYLYVAPAYFVYLLKHYCFDNDTTRVNKVSRSISLNTFKIKEFLCLGIVVVSVFAASFGPFIAMGQLGQVISRLFPFKRGLCHAYWAPNIWALYNIIDKALSFTVRRLGLPVSSNASMTSGLVGEMSHQVLPSITPLMTVTLTLVTIMPVLWRLWHKPSTPQDFLHSVILCGFSSFLFGWHVHEKAILMILLPMCYLAIEESSAIRIYLLLSVSGHISLFPLLFTSAETLIKVILFVLFTLVSFLSLPLLNNGSTNKPSSSDSPSQGIGSMIMLPGLTMLDSAMIAVLCAVQVYCVALHGLCGLLSHLPFLPLMATSVSCAIVMLHCWALELSMYYCRDSGGNCKKKLN